MNWTNLPRIRYRHCLRIRFSTAAGTATLSFGIHSRYWIERCTSVVHGITMCSTCIIGYRKDVHCVYGWDRVGIIQGVNGMRIFDGRVKHTRKRKEATEHGGYWMVFKVWEKEKENKNWIKKKNEKGKQKRKKKTNKILQWNTLHCNGMCQNTYAGGRASSLLLWVDNNSSLVNRIGVPSPACERSSPCMDSSWSSTTVGSVDLGICALPLPELLEVDVQPIWVPVTFEMCDM